MDNDIRETADNGENEVQIATIGEVIGTGADGEPVAQNVTEESLERLAQLHKDDEILVDADHESELGEKTEAKGWLSKLFVKPGVGLFGRIRWTDIGRRLIENRVFRWLSPSWFLDKETREPVALTSVALTNKPSQAGRIDPIVNSAPVEINDNAGIETSMSKEELVELVKETVKAALDEREKAAEAAEKAEEAAEKAEEAVDNSCGEEAQNEAPAEEKPEEKPAEEKPAEEKPAEEKPAEEKPAEEKEVIKLEALNSAPKTDGLDVVKGGLKSWEKLSGKDFIDWVNSGMK